LARRRSRPAPDAACEASRSAVAGVSRTTRGDGPECAPMSIGRARIGTAGVHRRARDTAPTAEVRQWGFGDAVYSPHRERDSAGRAIFDARSARALRWSRRSPTSAARRPRRRASPRVGCRRRRASVTAWEDGSRERPHKYISYRPRRPRIRGPVRPVNCSSTRGEPALVLHGGTTWNNSRSAAALLAFHR